MVPAFDIGRRAGLGLPIRDQDEAALAPAWTPTAPDVELPVYHSWTSVPASGGDFRSLAMLLRARPLPPEVGRRPFDVAPADAGGDRDDADPGAAGRWRCSRSRPRRRRRPDAAVRDRRSPGCSSALNVRGRRYRRPAARACHATATPQAAIGPLDATRARWYEQLNLDPVARVVAAFGTAVVQHHQETLVASAWQQAAELRRVNQVLRHLQLGAEVAGSMYRRHLSPLSPDAGLQLLAPAFNRLVLRDTGGSPVGFAGRLAATGVPPGATSSVVLRFARPRSALNRRVQRRRRWPRRPASRSPVGC